MKRLLVTFLGGLFGAGLAVSAGAANLDEVLLETADGQCSIHYLTDKNTQGWSIQTDSYDCPNQLLNGHAEVSIYNAFGQVVDHIYGYFSSGYWTGNQHLNAPVLKRTSDEKGVQKAIFIVGTNKTKRIDYIGQMSAHKTATGDYAPLSFCAPFRVLAVTQNTDVFNNEETAQEIIDDAAEKAKYFCPSEKRMMFFASTKMEPKQTDIFFFADVNLKTGAQNIVTKADSKPMVIKQEGGEVVSLVIPDHKKAPALKRGYIDRSKQPVASPLRPIAPVTVDTFDPVTDYDMPVDLPLPDMVSDGPDFSEELDVSADAADTTEVAAPEESFVPAETQIDPMLAEKRAAVSAMTLDPIAHLRVMMKVMKRPVTGNTVVHIESVGLDGTAKTDEPVQLILAGANLRRGWAVVSGLFTFDSDTGTGQADISGLIPCTSPMCKDLLP